MQFLAAIQAGGQSRRMGTDKAWLELNGHPMIERVLQAAHPVAHRLAIVISHTTREPERYAALAAQWQATLLIDQHDLRGPLGGIESSLLACHSNESALVVACDLPFLTTEFLQTLCEAHTRNASELTIPLDAQGRLNMLCGIYSNACLPPVQQMLAEDQLRVNLLCDKVPTYRLAVPDYSHCHNADQLLNNLNSPDEFNQARFR